MKIARIKTDIEFYMDYPAPHTGADDSPHFILRPYYTVDKELIITMLNVNKEGECANKKQPKGIKVVFTAQETALIRKLLKNTY